MSTVSFLSIFISLIQNETTESLQSYERAIKYSSGSTPILRECEKLWQTITHLKRMLLSTCTVENCSEPHTPAMLQKGEKCIEEVNSSAFVLISADINCSHIHRNKWNQQVTCRRQTGQHRDAIVWSSLSLLICKRWRSLVHIRLFTPRYQTELWPEGFSYNFSTVLLVHALILIRFMISLIQTDFSFVSLAQLKHVK